MPAPLRRRLSAFTLFVSLSVPALPAGAAPVPVQASEYGSAREAMVVGFGHLRSRDYEAARGPLEEAREALLAKHDAKKPAGRDLTTVQQGLMVVYRELGEPERLFEAGEFLLRDERYPMKYLAMRSMLGYVRTQKDRDLLRARFETALEKDPNDRVALRILSGVAESDRDPAKAAELLGRIIAADRKTDEGADGKDRAAHARLLEEADEHEVAATEYGLLAAEAEKLGETAPETFGSTMTAANLHLKAARNWLEADRTDEARAAAEAADRLGDAGLKEPHIYYFHSFLGGAWMKLDEPAKAVPHYETAVKNTTIYAKTAREDLEKARAAAKR